VLRLLICLLLPILPACERPAEQRGLYYWGAEVNVVCPCGSRACYWVRGEPAVLNPLRLYLQKKTSEPYQPIYLTYRGHILDEPTSGFAANYEAYQLISEVISRSVTLPEDCPAP
jgi:hypothetical protein